ncbi:MAG: hypothetical protein JRI66_11200 [Deltaproteobacteria bacterium]|nr:hypothetical protein [Deltaproteobacteria bacterium]
MTEITDQQVLTSLMSEEEVEGFVIKPWTIKQLMQVMPIINGVAEHLKQKGIVLENFAQELENQGLAGLTGLANIIIPHLPQFLATSLRIKPEEAEEIEMGKAIRLVVKVLALNMEHLKNSFSLVTGQMTPLTRQEAAH